MFSKGDEVEVFPSGSKSKIKAIEKYGEEKTNIGTGENATLLLEDEIDASRGNTIVKSNHSLQSGKQINAKICWMQSNALNPNNKYWLQHGVQKSMVKAKEINTKMNWQKWISESTESLQMNDIGEVSFQLAQPLLYAPFHLNKKLGAFILIDPNTNNTAGVGFIQ